jgi:hypothetical protein
LEKGEIENETLPAPANEKREKKRRKRLCLGAQKRRVMRQPGRTRLPPCW